MAIVVKDSFEPLSERSFASSDEPMLVKSDATRVLQQELLRYCQGRVTGRSFLVAGHRGAGKSTLVASAFLEVWNEAQREPGVMLRPILIGLHGPSLFPPVEAVPSKPKAEEPKPEKQKTEAARRDASAAATTDAEDDDASARSDKASAPKKADPIAPKSDAQIALEQIMLGLHRGVTKEFVRCYYDRMAFLSEIVDRTAPPGTIADAGLHRNRVMSALPADRSLFLVAAQFETELYDVPSAARLLQFYRLAGADANGVLYRVDSGPAAHQMISPLLSPGSAASVQGALELVALAGVLEAYRRISGEYTRSDSETDALKQENKRDAAAGGDLKNVVTPIAALLTGSIVTTGLAATTTNLPSALIGGILTALAAALVLKVSTTRTRNRDVTRQFKFVFDLSVATLDRVLPILIERLRKAGLAPVFVVDELDKVKDLGDRMLAMVHHLKKLVAENAFFCFLTDRSYYEQMAAASVNRQYSVEYTYFGRRLFVVYAPEDFERYLRDRIPDPEPASAAPGSAALPGSTDQALTDERAACAIIRWALRHRAQLHMLDLQREIAILHDQKGRITANAGELLSQQRIQIDATFQVAIELTLAEAKLVQAGAERPEFRRLMHDAMYYPTREWLKGKTSLDLTWDTGFKLFEAYLVERTAQDADAARTPTATTSVMRPFTDGEAEFLFEHVRARTGRLPLRPAVRRSDASRTVDAAAGSDECGRCQPGACEPDSTEQARRAAGNVEQGP